MLESMVTDSPRSHQPVTPKRLKSKRALSRPPSLFVGVDELAEPMLTRVVKDRAESHNSRCPPGHAAAEANVGKMRMSGGFRATRVFR